MLSHVSLDKRQALKSQLRHFDPLLGNKFHFEVFEIPPYPDKCVVITTDIGDKSKLKNSINGFTLINTGNILKNCFQNFTQEASILLNFPFWCHLVVKVLIFSLAKFKCRLSLNLFSLI